MSIWIEVVEPFTVKQGGRVTAWAAGQRVALSPDQAQRILDRVGYKVRVVGHDPLDPMIGTVVQTALDFRDGAGVRVAESRPWVVADAVGIDEQPGLRPGRWLLLTHGPDWRWTHESGVAAYRCPNCAGSRWWWSEHTVRCVRCAPPARPQWCELWRELAALCAGITPDDARYGPLLETLQRCDEAFKAGDYATFQAGVVRARRAAQGG